MTGWGKPLAADAIMQMLSNAGSLTPGLRARLSAPFVVRPPESWRSARVRLAIYGQETYGWYDDLTNCTDDPAQIDRLADTYSDFDFAESYPKFRRSAFWRAHRQLAAALEGNDFRKVLWLNLVKVDSLIGDAQSGSMWDNLSYPEIDEVSAWQRAAFLVEMEEAGARSAIFFTGPRYDLYIRNMLDDVRFMPIDGYGVSALCRLSHPRLPATSFRTYHPSYLARSGQWPLLETMTKRIAAEQG